MTATCLHCDLPLPRPLWGGDAPTDPEGAYCCFGCRLAAAIGGGSGDEGEARRTLARLGLAVFFTMNVMAFTMALWTSDVYAEGQARSGFATTMESLFRDLVMLFALPVAYLLGWPIWQNARDGLRRGVYSTDLLLAAGVAASFGYSLWSIAKGSGPIYFEVGCVVLVMVTLGRWLEATGKIHANDAILRLARLMPDRVRRVRDGSEEDVPLDDVAPGDLLRVLAGERLPADGRVRRGSAFVDQMVLTGESQPVARQAGDAVLGGTLNLDGDLLVEVTDAGKGGALGRLIELVRRARETGGRYERLADRVSSLFVPAVAAIALAAFAAHAATSGLERGLLQGMAVVLIACPCALGLATPLAVWTALGRAANAQVLFRSGDALERLAECRAIRFDKTGTLTTGEPTVAALVVEIEAERADVSARARALADASSHLLARSILRFDPRIGPDELAADDILAHSGRGVTGRIDRETVYLGSRRFLEENGLHIGPTLEEAESRESIRGRSMTWIAWRGWARGVYLFDERLRPSARLALSHLASLGLDVAVLTGDTEARGAALSRELGVPVRAALLPEGKVEAIREAREQIGGVVMVGDGVNDAPALAASDLGVALGCGTDLSREAAGVCLLGDDLERLPWAIELARRTRGVIRGNLAWAFGYNSLGIAAAAFGLLSPAFASFLMVGSSGFVILNSLRLREPEPRAATASPAPLPSPIAEAAA